MIIGLGYFLFFYFYSSKFRYEDRVLARDTQKLRARDPNAAPQSKNSSSPFIVKSSDEGMTGHSVYQDDFTKDKFQTPKPKPAVCFFLYAALTNLSY